MLEFARKSQELTRPRQLQVLKEARIFKAFLAAGVIDGILKESAVPTSVEHRAIFWRRCREVVVVRSGPS